MPAGRKATPVETKKLNGNPSKRPIGNEPEGDLFAKLPDPPEWLGEYGRKEWRRVGPVLIKMRLFTDADWMSFAMYCQNIHIMVEAALDIEENGHTILGARGRTRNPALTSFHNATNALRALAVEFGMTPSSRARIKLPDDPGESLEDLLGDSQDDIE